jgi:nucleoside-triphosphatase THEP1
MTKITISITALGPPGSRKSTAIKKLLVAIGAVAGCQLKTSCEESRRIGSKVSADYLWEERVTKEGEFSIKEIEDWDVTPLLSSIL